MDCKSHASIVGTDPLSDFVAARIAAVALKIVQFAIDYH